MTSLNPEQLRQTIVRTTAQIARSAGIDEADLLAVFADKEAVMQACAATLTEAVGVNRPAICWPRVPENSPSRSTSIPA